MTAVENYRTYIHEYRTGSCHWEASEYETLADAAFAELELVRDEASRLLGEAEVQLAQSRALAHAYFYDRTTALAERNHARELVVALEGEVARLRDGLVRIVQCHNYPMTITAEDVATGEVGPHGVDGCNCSDVLRIVHELLDAAAHPPESKPEGAWRDTACRDCCEGDRDCDDYPCPQIKGGTDG